MELQDPQQALKASDTAITDIRSYWDTLDPGLKARAMHDVSEDQQKRVIDLQREQMEAMAELAMAAARARAAVERGRPEDSDRIIAEVMEPLRARLRTLTDDVAEANALLDAYRAIGGGMA